MSARIYIKNTGFWIERSIISDFEKGNLKKVPISWMLDSLELESERFLCKAKSKIRLTKIFYSSFEADAILYQRLYFLNNKFEIDDIV